MSSYVSTLQEIADELKISKQFVHQKLMSGMTKFYKKSKKLCGPEISSYEVMLLMMKSLKLEDVMMKDFFNSFPEEIQIEIKESLTKVKVERKI